MPESMSKSLKSPGRAPGNARIRSTCGIATALLLASANSVGAEYPRLIRYLSTLPGYESQTCYGHVLEDRSGIPGTVLNLGPLDERLCSISPAPDSTATEIVLAFDAARAVIDSQDYLDNAEQLADGELAARILPPIAISRASLDAGRRVIIGAGLNFSEHRQEIGETSDGDTSDLVLFPKPVEPTGAYVPVMTGIEIGTDPPVPVRLLDYEVEIGLVFLDSIDLNEPAPSRAALFDSIAFFTANDVSARAPIILDEKFGFAQGKARPGYLPMGPWLVHGSDLDLAAGGAGSIALEMALSVSDTASTAAVRQSDSSASIMHGPVGIVAELGRRYRANAPMCMRDAHGKPYLLHDGHGIIPAGSLLLTGTPGGTALRRPGFLDTIRLFIEGGLSFQGARREFLEENIESDDASYLRPGVSVKTEVELLGAQRWTVVRSSSAEPYGEPGPGECTD